MRGTIPENQGAILYLNIADAGAGNPRVIYADLGRRYLIDAVYITYTTDATVLDRQVYWEYWGGVGDGARVYAYQSQAASLVGYYSFIPGLGSLNYSFHGRHIIGFGPRVMADATYGIRISATGIQAGDAFTDCLINGQQWLDD